MVSPAPLSIPFAICSIAINGYVNKVNSIYNLAFDLTNSSAEPYKKLITGTRKIHKSNVITPDTISPDTIACFAVSLAFLCSSCPICCATTTVAPTDKAAKNDINKLDKIYKAIIHVHPLIENIN